MSATTVSPSGTTGEPGPLARLRHLMDSPTATYYLLMSVTTLLVSIGLVMVLSASSVSAYVNYRDAYYYVKRQAFFLFVGLIGIVVIVKLPPRGLKIAGWPACSPRR